LKIPNVVTLLVTAASALQNSQPSASPALERRIAPESIGNTARDWNTLTPEHQALMRAREWEYGSVSRAELSIHARGFT
jgi:hypothetical protein